MNLPLFDPDAPTEHLWVLDGKVPRRAASFNDWMTRDRDPRGHIAAHMVANRYWVSSIFLPVAIPRFGYTPRLFETMMFDKNRNGDAVAQARFADWDSCERHHFLMVLGNALAVHYWHKRAGADMPPEIDFRGGERGKYADRAK